MIKTFLKTNNKQFCKFKGKYNLENRRYIGNKNKIINKKNKFILNIC